MKKFKHKPVIVEAKQWAEGGDKSKFPNSIGSNSSDINPFSFDKPCRRCELMLNFSTHLYIQQFFPDKPYNLFTVCPRDWLIKGIDGELYTCKPDMFEKKYEKCED